MLYSTTVVSAARTTSGNSEAQDVRSQSERGVGTSHLNVQLDVTAVSGTSPTLDVEIEWSNDGTSWSSGETADTFAQAIGPVSVVKRVDVKAALYRVKWTVGGTSPSFTFSVSVLETP